MPATKITYTVHIEPEEMEVRGNVQASGNAAEDKAAEDEVLERLRNGEEWAWCCVQVVAEDGVGNIGKSSWLGGCNYEDEDAFRTPGGYFDDLCQEALADLNAGRMEKRRAEALTTLAKAPGLSRAAAKWELVAFMRANAFAGKKERAEVCRALIEVLDSYKNTEG